MPKVKSYNLDEIEDVERNFEPYDGPTPKPGIYSIKVARTESKQSSNNNDMIEVIGEIQDKPYKGCPVWIYIVFAEGFALQRAKETLLAFGMPKKGTPDKWAKLLEGKPARVRVKRDTYEGNPTIKVTDVLPAKAKAAQDADEDAEDAEDQDDSADDADGEDDDDDAPF